VIDMHMPDVSGLELAQAIRAVPGLSTLPLILLTSDQGVDSNAAAVHAISATLTKPVQQSALFNALSRVPVTPQLQPGDAGKHSAGKVFNDAKILLVEDNEINQTVALGILNRLGYRADVAGDGKEALELTARQDYDVILMDCQMPRLDGYAATRELRARAASRAAAGERVRHTPVIAMTAATFAADRKRCFDAGMDDFVGKPVRAATLQATLLRWLRRAPGTQPEPDVEALQVPAPRGPEPARDSFGQRVAELLGDGTPVEIELVHDIVTSFGSRSVELLAHLADGLTNGDIEAIHLHAHTLAGAALNLGAEDVAHIGREIEADARNGDLEACMTNLPVLMTAVDAARARLSQVLETLPPVPSTS
jgi:CheY-like chemotaxis protein/HPt (histidine-containing phosphotransfer) domain-containing protein